MKTELKIRTEAFRKYMASSGLGISDAGLRRLAGWTSFNNGWDAAIKNISLNNKDLSTTRRKL